MAADQQDRCPAGEPCTHRYKQWRFNRGLVRIDWKPIGRKVLLSVAAQITGHRRTAAALARLGTIPRRPFVRAVQKRLGPGGSNGIRLPAARAMAVSRPPVWPLASRRVDAWSAGILAAMPERTATCGECGAATIIPDGDWNTVQALAVGEWQREHEVEVHDGEDVIVELDPSPLNEDS